MKKVITIALLVAAWIPLDACKKAESMMVARSQEIRHELDARGVLSAAKWTEENVDHFFEDNRGKTPAEILKILGEPRTTCKESTETTFKYVIEGRVRNVAVGTEFSGFSLKFNDGVLTNISKDWGYQPF